MLLDLRHWFDRKGAPSRNGASMSCISAMRAQGKVLPPGTDWGWRPDFMETGLDPAALTQPQGGATLGQGTALWHDCADCALGIEQIRNQREGDATPFGLRFNIADFRGSYVSICLDLPSDAVRGLTRDHILRMETCLSSSHRMRVYGRINIVNGPNTDLVTQELGDILPVGDEVRICEFDLAYTQMNEKRLDRIWLDMIFETPADNSFDLRDLSLLRYHRAEF